MRSQRNDNAKRKRSAHEQTLEQPTKHMRTTNVLSQNQKNDLRAFASFAMNTQKKLSGMATPELTLQDQLFIPSELGIDSSKLTNSSGYPIDASVGSSGFVAPKKTFAAIHTYNREDVIEYGYHKEILAAEHNLTTYLAEEKLIDSGTSIEFTEEGQIPKNNTLYATLGCGSQHIISVLFNVIIKHPNDVIIIPTPTYGLFFKLIKEAAGEYTFLPLQKKDHFKPNPTDVIELIASTNNKLHEIHQEQVKFKIAKIKKYLFKNNHNREINSLLYNLEKNFGSKTSLCSKIIRNLNQKVADYIDSHPELFNTQNPIQLKILKDDLIQKLAIPYRNCVRGYLHLNPHNPSGSVMTQPEIDAIADALATTPKVKVIEDLAHRGIALSDTVMGFFSRSKIKDRTVSVYSFSKSFALAGMRTGFGVGQHKLINKIAKKMYESHVVPPISVVSTLNAVLTTQKGKRDAYLSQCNLVYQIRLSLMFAYIFGITSIQDANLKEKLLEVISIENLPLDSTLQTGIINLNVLNDPDGCFFVMLDFSQYQGYYIGETQLNTGIDFANLLYYIADVKTIPSEVNGYFDIPSVRFSLSIAEVEICKAMMQIKHALSYLTPAPNPKFEYDRSLEMDKPVTLLKRR